MRKFVTLFFVLLTLCVIAFARDYFTIQGVKLSEQELVAAEKTVMLFWTTWCPSCRDQLKFMGSRCAEFEKSGITVRLVNVGEPQARVMQFVDKMDLGHCQIVLDQSGSLARKFGILGFPTYLFYKNGQEMTRANTLSQASLEKILNAF